MHTLRLVEKSDLEELAHIFVSSFNSIDPVNTWDYEHALAYLTYWTEKQPDMFWGAFDTNNKPLGAMAVNIKPWRTGIRCNDGVVFVDQNQQQKGVGSELFKTVLTEAKNKYNATQVEGITFAGSEFPYSWYKKIGIRKNENAILIKGEINEVLSNLNKN